MKLPSTRAHQSRQLARPSLARAAALATAGLLAVAAAGCSDRDPAETEARARLAAAVGNRSAQGTDYGAEAQQVAATSDASDATKAVAQDLVGDAALVEANNLLLTGEPDSESGEPQGLLVQQGRVVVAAARMDRLANVIVLGGALGQAQRGSQQSLAEVVTELREQAAQIRTGETWAPRNEQGEPMESVSVPGANAVAEQAADLEAQIEAKTEEIANLENTRRDALRQANDRELEGDNLTGDESIAAAREVADFRNDAATTTVEIAEAQRQLARLQEQLAGRQALAAALEEAAANLDGQAEQLDEFVSGSGEGSLNASLAQLRQAMQRLVEGDSSNPDAEALALVATDLNNAAGEAARLRDDALAAAGDAQAAFAAAEQLAGSVGSQTRGTGGPFASLGTSYGNYAKQLKLAGGDAHRLEAEVYLSDAVMQSALLRLADTIERARGQGGGTLPDLPDVDIEGAAAQYARSVSGAAEALQEADGVLDTVAQSAGNNAELQRAALTQRAIVVSGMMGLRNLVDSTGQLNTPGAEVSAGVPDAGALGQTATQIRAAAEPLGRLPYMPFFAAMSGGDDPAPPAEPEATPEGEGENTGVDGAGTADASDLRSQLVGTWRSGFATPENDAGGSFGATQTAELAEDGTAVWTISTSDPQGTGQARGDRVAEGTWSVDGGQLVIELTQAPGGGEIPEAQRTITIPVSTDDAGNIQVGESGVQFERVENGAETGAETGAENGAEEGAEPPASGRPNDDPDAPPGNPYGSGGFNYGGGDN